MAYTSSLDILETEIAIKKVKDFFESHLSKELDLLSQVYVVCGKI